MKDAHDNMYVSDRLNPKSTLVCNLALRECKVDNEMLNTPISIMEHMIKNHGWKRIPQLAQEDIENHKVHPHFKQVMTEESYLNAIKERPEVWWFDMQFIWTDIRNLHFLHKNSKGIRELRSYYHW